MDRELIIQALKNTCGNKNLKYQVIIEQEQLYIYINRRQDYQPDYLRLKENIGAAIANLAWDNLDGAWLYSRPIGQIEPDWNSFLELPTQITRGDDDTLDQTENIESELDFGEFEFPPEDSTGDTGLLQDTGMVHKNLLQEEAIVSANTSATQIEQDDIQDLSDEFAEFEDFEDTDDADDTGLLHDTGFIHGSPLKEEEIDIFTNGLTDSKVLKANNLNSDNLNLDSSSLAQHYCFITNEKLLTGKVTPPDKEIMRLVKFFHHLADSERYILLPILDDYFKLGKISNLEDRPIAVQNWLKQIGELNDEKRHITAIWLSRYCANSSNTLAEFEAITAQNAADMVGKKAKKTSTQRTEYSFTPANTHKSSSLQERKLEPPKSKFKLPSAIKKLLLPLAWILATVILVTLAVLSNNLNTIVADQQIPALCNISLGSPEYCRLAVNLVGEKTITRSPQSLFPLTEVTESIAQYGCERYANLKAGIPIENIAPEITPVVSSGEKIFPHIYVIEAQQKNFLKLGNTRVGCVYTTGKGQRSPKKLAADVIPLNWPTEYYQQQKTGLFFGRYTNLIKLGLYTIFAAWGIAIASWLNLGIKIKQASTICLVALLLGAIQLIASSLTSFGLLATYILPILGIFIISFAIKDFQINWSRGYLLVATSMFIIITIQFLFSNLFLELISNLV